MTYVPPHLRNKDASGSSVAAGRSLASLAAASSGAAVASCVGGGGSDISGGEEAGAAGGPCDGQSAPGRDWFSHLFGFSEHTQRREVFSALTDISKFIEIAEAADGGRVMKSTINGHEYAVGTFACPSLAELRDDPDVSAARGKGTLRLSVQSGDVAEFHADPRNARATFQAASQFNCLEFVGPEVTPEDGVTGYSSDRTQGPACSIACGPATVYRNYFVEGLGLPEGQR